MDTGTKDKWARFCLRQVSAQAPAGWREENAEQIGAAGLNVWEEALDGDGGLRRPAGRQQLSYVSGGRHLRTPRARREVGWEQKSDSVRGGRGQRIEETGGGRGRGADAAGLSRRGGEARAPKAMHQGRPRVGGQVSHSSKQRWKPTESRHRKHKRPTNRCNYPTMNLKP